MSYPGCRPPHGPPLDFPGGRGHCAEHEQPAASPPRAPRHGRPSLARAARGAGDGQLAARLLPVRRARLPVSLPAQLRSAREGSPVGLTTATHVRLATRDEANAGAGPLRRQLRRHRAGSARARVPTCNAGSPTAVDPHGRSRTCCSLRSDSIVRRAATRRFEATPSTSRAASERPPRPRPVVLRPVEARTANNGRAGSRRGARPA